jgi:hypothetical protein
MAERNKFWEPSDDNLPVYSGPRLPEEGRGYLIRDANTRGRYADERHAFGDFSPGAVGGPFDALPVVPLALEELRRRPRGSSPFVTPPEAAAAREAALQHVLRTHERETAAAAATRADGDAAAGDRGPAGEELAQPPREERAARPRVRVRQEDRGAGAGELAAEAGREEGREAEEEEEAPAGDERGGGAASFRAAREKEVAERQAGLCDFCAGRQVRASRRGRVWACFSSSHP